jgi:hypothetical protein
MRLETSGIFANLGKPSRCSSSNIIDIKMSTLTTPDIKIEENIPINGDLDLKCKKWTKPKHRMKIEEKLPRPGGCKKWVRPEPGKKIEDQLSRKGDLDLKCKKWVRPRKLSDERIEFVNIRKTKLMSCG